MADEILFTDRDGNQAIRRDGKVIYKGEEYPIVPASEAAEKILRGEELRGCYIESITRATLLEAEKNLKTGNLVEEEEKVFLARPRLTLRSPIICRRCLIGKLDLSVVTFSGRADFSGAIFNGWADFEWATFSGRAVFMLANFSGGVMFSKATFSGDADFRVATFRGGAHFFRATFSGRGDLSSANFSGEAHFPGATFSGRADFRRATFSGEADFEWATFSREADFEWATFSGRADFREATLSGEADFEWATFSGRADLSRATFSDRADFSRATFSGDAWLRGCAFLSCDLSGARFEKLCDLTSVAAGSLDLSNAVFTESVRLSAETYRNSLAEFFKRTRAFLEETKAWAKSKRRATKRRLREAEGKGDEHNVEALKGAVARHESDIRRNAALQKLLEEWQASGRAIHRVNFSGTLVQGDLRCDFEHLKPVKTRRFPMPRYEPVLAPHADGNWREAEKQYAWLKEQYRKQGRYADEDNAHWWASECARRRTPLTGNPFWLLIPLVAAYLCDGILGPKSCLDALPLLIVALFGSCLLFLPRLGKWLVFRKAFGHGVRPQNILITIGVVVAFFGLVFYIAHLTGDIVPHPGNDTRPAFASQPLNSLYFSVITFATVGYGDVRALGWAASAAMLEGLLGILLNAALVVVIFRKVVR